MLTVAHKTKVNIKQYNQNINRETGELVGHVYYYCFMGNSKICYCKTSVGAIVAKKILICI